MLVNKAGLQLDEIHQVQRYPVSNHLYWLSHGQPGGHRKWLELNTTELEVAYENALADMGKCDTIVAKVSI